MKIIITALFGLESLVRQDLESVGFSRENIEVSDGVISLSVKDADIGSAVARANIWVRHGERVLLEIDHFKADTFDDFFDQMRVVRWETYIPDGYAFHVNGYSRKSALFGIPACQGLCKKAIVGRLQETRYKGHRDIVPEDARKGLINVRFSIVSDQVSVMIDTTGDGLHKRGYRPLRHIAPIKESLASGLVCLSNYKPFGYEALVDPFCGSGTIVIEAAMRALNIAPGLHRPFDAEKWPFIGKKYFDDMRKEARTHILHSKETDICFFGSDIDPVAVSNAKKNARNAGVEHVTRFKVSDATEQTIPSLAEWTKRNRQLIVCNPPYGGRLLSPEDASVLFEMIADLYLDQDGYCKKGIRLSVIAPDEQFEAEAGRKADKRKKLYNGNIRCQMYHYFRMRK